MPLPETPQDYTARILTTLGDEDPMTVLGSTAARLRQLIDGRSVRDLGWTPEPGRWSVTQILAHLADAEIVGAWRFRSILAADAVPIQAFDQNAWAATFRYEQADPFESVRSFDANRTGTLALLRRVDPALHANYGMHAERGKETITHLLRMYAGHDRNHLAQIERLVAALP